MLCVKVFAMQFPTMLFFLSSIKLDGWIWTTDSKRLTGGARHQSSGRTGRTSVDWLLGDKLFSWCGETEMNEMKMGMMMMMGMISDRWLRCLPIYHIRTVVIYYYFS